MTANQDTTLFTGASRAGIQFQLLRDVAPSLPGKTGSDFRHALPLWMRLGATAALVWDPATQKWLGSNGVAGNMISAELSLACDGSSPAASFVGVVDRGADCQGNCSAHMAVTCFPEGLDDLSLCQVALQHGCCGLPAGEGTYGMFMLTTAPFRRVPCRRWFRLARWLSPRIVVRSQILRVAMGASSASRPQPILRERCAAGAPPGRTVLNRAARPTRPPPDWAAAGTARPPVFSAAPVRYANGEVSVVSNDLEAWGFGLPWGHTRSFASRLTKFDSDNLGQGYNWLVQEWPYLIADLTGSVVVQGEPNTACWFDLVAGQYTPRFNVKLAPAPRQIRPRLPTVRSPGHGHGIR